MKSPLLLTVVILSLLSAMAAHKVFPPPRYQNLLEEGYLISQSNCPHLQLSPNQQILSQGWDLQPYFHKIMSREYKLCSCPYSFEDLKENSQMHSVKIQYHPDLNKQEYSILSSPSECLIQVSSYQGYVYAMETLSQLIDGGQILLGEVNDEPQVEYRGIMIDSVRHFLSFEYVKRLILTMPIVKLNMLHWHLSDDQAFVLELKSHPELALEGAYDQHSYYTLKQMNELIQIARENAVNIIPEFDSPGHVRSWGLSAEWHEKNITILCPKGQGYNHQFDLSKQEVYTLVEEVLVEVSQIFKDSPYLHLGGDEVFGTCWEQRPEIKQFMAKNNISSYGGLQTYWRKQLKSKLAQGQSVIFWRNDATDLETFPEDVFQFWGAQSDTKRILSGVESKAILSPSDYLYLNKGQSFIWQNTTGGEYTSWRKIYENFTVFPQGVNKEKILGAEVCLWGEVSNERTFQNNLWPRSTAFAAKVWSKTVLSTSQLVEKIIETNKVMKGQGVKVSPIASQFCEKNVIKCFPQTQAQIREQ